VRGRKCRAGGELRAPDRKAAGLGESDQSLACGGGQIVAEQNDHSFGIEASEALGEPGGVGRGAEPRRVGSRRRRTADLLVENVHRQRQEYRPGRRCAGDGEGAPQRLADILAAPHFLGPLGHRRRERDEIAGEPRLGHQMTRVLLAGGDHERGLARLRGDEHAHRIAEPAHCMQVDEAGAARGQRPAVRHADRRRLLEAKHVGDVGRVDERVHQRHLGRARIAEDMRDSLVAKDVEENVASASGHEPDSWDRKAVRYLSDVVRSSHGPAWRWSQSATTE
jgi:hypothetical protein